MSEFRRGFKAWCEKASVGVRRDLNLGWQDRLMPQELAKNLGIRVVFPEDIPDLNPLNLQQLTVEDGGSWSAVTMLRDGKKLVILNSSCSLARQASSLMHELSHIILDHEPARIDVSPEGMMLLHTYDLQQESEADWLAAAVLVPRDALLAKLKDGKSIEQCAIYFGVSVQLARMRKDRTGIERQLSYQRA